MCNRFVRKPIKGKMPNNYLLFLTILKIWFDAASSRASRTHMCINYDHGLGAAVAFAMTATLASAAAAMACSTFAEACLAACK